MTQATLVDSRADVKRRWYVLGAARLDACLGLAIRAGKVFSTPGYAEWQVEIFLPGLMLGVAFGFQEVPS